MTRRRLQTKRGSACYDKGAIRIRRRRQQNRTVEVRFIKVRNGGPFARRWIPLARFTWEQMHGPIPAGYRVIHVDGNTLNDNPANYALMTAGEFIRHCHQRDREMSLDNRYGPKRRQATAKHNRERAAVLRNYRFLDRFWYPVDHRRCEIHNTPFRSRRLLFEQHGVELPLNGVCPRGVRLPLEAIRGHRLNEDRQRYLQYDRIGNAPCVRRDRRAAAGPRHAKEDP